MDIQVGDILKMKKQHPCGSAEWEVLRIGADFRLKCMGCGHQIMIPRVKAEKNVRGVTKYCKNKERLEKSIRQLEDGKGTEHDLIEVD